MKANSKAKKLSQRDVEGSPQHEDPGRHTTYPPCLLRPPPSHLLPALCKEFERCTLKQGAKAEAEDPREEHWAVKRYTWGWRASSIPCAPQPSPASGGSSVWHMSFQTGVVRRTRDNDAPEQDMGSPCSVSRHLTHKQM